MNRPVLCGAWFIVLVILCVIITYLGYVLAGYFHVLIGYLLFLVKNSEGKRYEDGMNE